MLGMLFVPVWGVSVAFRQSELRTACFAHTSELFSIYLGYICPDLNRASWIPRDDPGFFPSCAVFSSPAETTED